MSAYVHNNQHIIAIISGAQYHQLEATSINGVYCNVGIPEHAQLVANILLGENIRSVNYRYDENEPINPGIDFKQDNRALSPLALLKAINSLDYQSCETPDWRETFACKLLENWSAQLLKLAGTTEEKLRNNKEYDQADTWNIPSWNKQKAI